MTEMKFTADSGQEFILRPTARLHEVMVGWYDVTPLAEPHPVRTVLTYLDKDIKMPIGVEVMANTDDKSAADRIANDIAIQSAVIEALEPVDTHSTTWLRTGKKEANMELTQNDIDMLLRFITTGEIKDGKEENESDT